MGDAQPLIKICSRGPAAVTEKLELVSGLRMPDVATIWYCVPRTPPKTQSSTFTTPATACRSPQEERVPVAGVTESEIVAEEMRTTLPAESSTFTTGSDVSDEPATPPTGWLVKANWVGTPATVGEIGLLVTDTAPWAAVNV